MRGCFWRSVVIYLWVLFSFHRDRWHLRVIYGVIGVRTNALKLKILELTFIFGEEKVGEF